MVADCTGYGRNGDTRGDQSGKEYRITSWYDGGWNYMMRHPNATVRQYIAANAIAAANGNKVGYSNSDRRSFWDELERVGYDASKLENDCNADCSSSTCAVCKAAGYLANDDELKELGIVATYGMASVFKNVGFEVTQDTKYLRSKDYLIPGDVLLQDGGGTYNVINGINVYTGHATIYVGSNASATTAAPVVTDGSNVYIIGDSLTVGATSKIKAKLPNATIDAISSTWWSKSSSGLPSGISRLSKMGSQPILVFAMGSNGGINDTDIANLESATAGKNLKIVVMTIFYTSPYGSGAIAQANSSNAVIKKAVETHPNWTLMDWDAAVSGDPSKYIADGVHGTSAGYDVFTDIMISAINSSGGGLSTSLLSVSSGTVVGGITSMFSSRYELGDAVVREFCYLDIEEKNNHWSELARSLNLSKFGLSVINYAPLVEDIADAKGVYNMSSGIMMLGSYNTDTSGLSGNAKIIVDYLLSKGLNGAAACGVIGNIYYESGFNTASVGDGGTSFGICQWHAGRGAAMKSFVGSNWANDLSGQCDYLWHDLSTNYTSVLSHLQSVPNTDEGAQSAAEYFVRHFEIPSNMEENVRIRRAKASEYYNMLIITAADSLYSSAVNGQLISYSGRSLTLQKTVQVPQDVQNGLVGNFTNYTYWYSRWGWKCRTIADIWNSQGRPSSKGIATVSGHYLVAMSSVFASTGDLVVIHLVNGESFSAVLGDSKGSDAGSRWGHIMGTGLVDIIEWEAIGSATSAAGGTNIDLGTWKGVKVASVDNYGAWLDS